MRLTGSSFKKRLRRHRASISQKRKSSKKRVRRLFGNAKGSFRTSGRNAAATVRGTRWSVQDRCDGTLVTVQRGRVEVRDKVKRKTIIVRTGPHLPRQGPVGPARRLRHGWARSSSSRRGPGSGRARARSQSRTALVLGGGGFTGGVYEIGALRALDLLSVNRSVNQFDIYVGTSAGSLIAALAANGITPEQMMRIVNNQVPTPFRDINLDMLLRPNYREYATKALQLPLHLLGVARSLGRSLGSFSSVDLAIAIADALPSGLYTGSGIEEYVRTVLSDPDRTDDFRLLQNELYVAATDLDTCERIVLGAEGWDDVPISTAVRASTALPMVYKPTIGQGPRADRRRRGVDHQRRHRGRGGREVRRRGQPARPVRQRLLASRSRRCSARACAVSRTWASRRSPTRRSSCSPTSACTRWRASGRTATRASTSS